MLAWLLYPLRLRRARRAWFEFVMHNELRRLRRARVGLDIALAMSYGHAKRAMGWHP